MIIPVSTRTGGYKIVLERGAARKAGEYLSLDRKVLIVTDSGVPRAYADAVAAQCREPFVFRFPEGEKSKNMETLTGILTALVNNSFTRTDCVAAVGGGVAGDLAGFAAACYMRGIDFYNIPTTLLSQVDSSIGGKTGLDFCGCKNIVGAFYPPRAVIIDSDTLSTLPERQLKNGLAESVKMALTCDIELFRLFEKDGIPPLDTVIERSLLIKKRIVEEDEHESGRRKILNFGHTLAHAIEGAEDFGEWYHGECVAVGMLPMCSAPVEERLRAVLEKIGLPTKISADKNELSRLMGHDKKLSGDSITDIFVNEAGSCEMLTMPLDELIKRTVR